MPNNSEERKPLPPYIPLKTLTGFIQKLRDTTVPSRVDSSLMRSYSGSVARQLVAAMKWLGLIDDNGYTTSILNELVVAYGTDRWGDQFGQLLAVQYSDLLGGLDLDKATAGMLAEKFRAVGAEGQVLQKCITFYIAAMRNAGWNISPHLVEKAPRQRGERKPKAKQNSESGSSEVAKIEPPMPGMVKFNLPIPDKSAATIILPADLTTDDWDMVSSMMSAYIARRQKK